MRALKSLRVSIAAAMTVALAAGCSGLRSGTENGGTAAGPRAGSCALIKTTARTCVERNGKRPVCYVYVGETDTGIYVFPGTLRVPKQTGSQKDVVIIWRIANLASSEFKADDGPQEFVGQGANQADFDGGEPTQDPDGDHKPGAGAQHYKVRLKDARTIPASPGYKYTLQVSTGSGKASCDPFIVSEAD